MLGIEFHHPPLLRIAYGQRRGQRVELDVVFAVEPHVGGELLEAFDLGVERHLVRVEEPLGDVEYRPVIAAAVVVVGQRHQRGDVGRVDLHGAVVLRHGQRVLVQNRIEVGQHHMVLRFVGGGFDHGLGLVDGFVQLPRGDQQLAFHRAQHRDAPEAEFRRVERGDGRIGLLDLLVERRQKPVVVGVLRICGAQALVDAEGFGVTLGEDQGLSEELVIPFVRRVEPVGAAGQLHRLVGRGVHAVGRHFVIGRRVGRISADRFGEKFPRPDRIVKNGILFDALGIEPDAAQRIGVTAEYGRGGTLPRGESRAEEYAECRCRCQTFHGSRF